MDETMPRKPRFYLPEIPVHLLISSNIGQNISLFMQFIGPHYVPYLNLKRGGSREAIFLQRELLKVLLTAVE